MTKQGVEPDEFSQPFWDAANEERLVIRTAKLVAGSSIRRRRPAGSAAISQKITETPCSSGG